MEFCQWLKHFYSIKATPADYNGLERRNEAIASYGSGHKHAAKQLPASVIGDAASAPAPAFVKPARISFFYKHF